MLLSFSLPPNNIIYMNLEKKIMMWQLFILLFLILLFSYSFILFILLFLEYIKKNPSLGLVLKDTYKIRPGQRRGKQLS